MRPKPLIPIRMGFEWDNLAPKLLDTWLVVVDRSDMFFCTGEVLGECLDESGVLLFDTLDFGRPIPQSKVL